MVCSDNCCLDNNVKNKLPISSCCLTKRIRCFSSLERSAVSRSLRASHSLRLMLSSKSKKKLLYWSNLSSIELYTFCSCLFLMFQLRRSSACIVMSFYLLASSIWLPAIMHIVSCTARACLRCLYSNTYLLYISSALAVVREYCFSLSMMLPLINSFSTLTANSMKAIPSVLTSD